MVTVTHLWTDELIRARGSTEHEISIAHKMTMMKNKDPSCFLTLRCSIHPANKCLNAIASIFLQKMLKC